MGIFLHFFCIFQRYTLEENKVGSKIWVVILTDIEFIEHLICMVHHSNSFKCINISNSYKRKNYLYFIMGKTEAHH